MNKQTRLEYIKRVLNNNYITCKHCFSKYMPMNELTSKICPICQKDLLGEVTILTRIDLDSFDEIDLSEV